MSEQSRRNDAAESAHGSDLPLLVVDRTAQVPAQRAVPRSWLQRLRIVPLLLIMMPIGGLVGIYFQPPILRAVMGFLGIEAGGGTSDPIAVPVHSAAGTGLVGADSQPTLRPIVVGLGRLLPSGDVVTVAAPLAAQDARVSRLEVTEGDAVSPGDVIAVLDKEATLAAALDAAHADAALHQASLFQARASVIASIEEARAAVRRAEANLKNASDALARVETLTARGVVAESVRDDHLAERDQAASDLDSARATLSRYETEGVDTQPDVVVAMRSYDAALAQVARAERDLENAYVRAPITGTVLDIHVSPGEAIGTEGVADVGNIAQMVAEIEIFETEIGRVAIGADVTLRSPALDAPLAGQVVSIGFQVERQTVVGEEPAAATDARVVEVTVALDPASSERASRLTNLQVTGEIAVAEAAQ